VFFLPLCVAVLHVAGSLKMISLMLKMFGLLDVPYIALNALGASIGVAALYLLFYWRTAKSYYKLVKF
ncbi:MAG: ABC transporter permease, partial [Eubacteriales bacterium]|nr:ABC transporter permease [Eubacteriales bacterium]